MIIIGNIISFIAAMFMILSCVSKSKQNIFIFQFLECSFLAVASMLFGSLAGATTLVISAVRNLFVAKNKFTKTMMYFFVLITVIVGLLVNTKGLIGLMPIVATVEYTICSHYITGIKETRYSIFVNVLIWVIYSFLIYDFSTAITDLIVLIVDVAVIIKLSVNDNKALKRG